MNRPIQISASPGFINFCKSEAMKNEIRHRQHLGRKQNAMANKAGSYANYFKQIIQLTEQSNSQEVKKIRDSITQKQDILKRDIDPDIRIMIRQDIELLSEIIADKNNSETDGHE
jgi:molecular chaperone DnaK (HSP70)